MPLFLFLNNPCLFGLFINKSKSYKQDKKSKKGYKNKTNYNMTTIYDQYIDYLKNQEKYLTLSDKNLEKHHNHFMLKMKKKVQLFYVLQKSIR